MKNKALYRLPVVALAMGAMMGGLVGGLYRLGSTWLPVGSDLGPLHGPWMVCVFLGTVITMERAVALGARWAYVPVACCVASGVAGVVAPGSPVAPGVVVAAGVGLVAVYGALLRRQRSIDTGIMALGAVMWVVGSALWLMGGAVFEMVWWWMGFLVLTIAGERLELSRLRRRPRYAEPLLVGLMAVFVVGASLTVGWPEIGVRTMGVALALVGLWLGVWDIARGTIKARGQVRYVASALLAGFGWLVVGGAVMAVVGEVRAGPLYDAALHTIFVGFVFSMIFGHAPIVAPALFKVLFPWNRAFYVPLALLHLGLVLRVVGDLVGIEVLRSAGGWGSAAAIVIFIGTIVGSFATRAAASRRRLVLANPE